MGKGGSGFEKGRRLQCRKTRRRTAALPARFDDLFNFVHDPATLYVAYCRVEGHPRGTRERTRY
jgi:hypothetical protein